MRPVKGHEGEYSVTEDGRVWSHKTGKFLKPGTTDRGYLKVTLHKDAFIHVLVAEAYVPNPEGLPEVNHEDGDKANNRSSNLTWTTSQGNKIHAVQTGLHKTRLSMDQVREIRLRSSNGESGLSIASDYLVSPDVIWRIIKRKMYAHIQ
jgi:hypothetical protein